MELKLYSSSEHVYHVRDGEKSSSMLTRYGILKGKDIPVVNNDDISVNCTSVTFSAKRMMTVDINDFGGCYSLTFTLADGERLFGLGDSNRENFMIRGMKITLYKENVKCYGPMPIVLSSEGWALFINTTYKTVFDLGASEKNKMTVKVYGGQIDFYLLKSDTLIGLTQEITKITGRPILLPKFAYGFTVVNNERINEIELLEYTRLYREYDIPCDCMGLEPSWMSKNYDFSTDKEWNNDKFYVPYWKPKNTSDRGTFFHPLRHMGMQLSLWLCEDYDLLYNEEKMHHTETTGEFPDDAEIQDKHLLAPVYLDKITKRDERWFEHLKKFVDNGATAFKLDASNQVLAHPDRLWGDKFTDAEVHNLYPVLLAKDMESGHREYTDRRLMINTSCAYVGTQQYAATWAGDTGGGPKTLVSVMNYAVCGHSNTGCDIDVTNLESMHYGFLMPWTQQNNWNSWNYPWYLGEELRENCRFYSKMRSSLFPYLYYTSYKAYADGTPMLRPLAFIYENDRRFDNIKNAYMLGDSLYVGAFNMHLSLPEGRWIDYFTGEVYEGGNDINYKRPDGIGGALFVKDGSVIVTMTPQRYLLEREHEYIINLYPSECAGSTVIYEDDGYTYEYQSGGYAVTEITSSGISDSKLTLTVGKRVGGFDGKPDNGHNILNNSIPSIKPMPAISDIKVIIHGAHPKHITLDGVELPYTSAAGKCEFTVDKALHASRSLEFEIEF